MNVDLIAECAVDFLNAEKRGNLKLLFLTPSKLIFPPNSQKGMKAEGDRSPVTFIVENMDRVAHNILNSGRICQKISQYEGTYKKNVVFHILLGKE